MANINIEVSKESNFFTISLDRWEWTSLRVNNKPIKPITKGGIQFQFIQNEKTEVPIHFEAIASKRISLGNGPNILYLKGIDVTYFCAISYFEDSDKSVTLHGTLIVISSELKNSKPGPLSFNQGNMTGWFQTKK